ncbi:DALR anticodon-binding domain-containing protein [Sphaerisporangium sp. TRM90804]|uniref:DALR anticodon-binding domain-containing protein n=1 Tax=Sphaerisporangium sp. TRM90804 TaxID=3031113 RepID=UPI002448208A|nr:DALR anticodon-binding domain-containing protein [Sphaerisporangium sp. TRM90804]MDH2428101.1 DALR anticodon-binding domain-containing protein [Sphaerisporangium sp. TRM90804]
MCVEALTAALGAAPVPRGGWGRTAAFVSSAAAGDGASGAGELAARVRAVPGVRKVDVRADGLLVIEVAVPGEIVREILTRAGAGERAREADGTGVGTGAAGVGSADEGEERGGPWPDFPRTWSNPGFAVRYAYVRAGDVARWARELGVEGAAGFRPELLADATDRAVLRVLAELPSRRESRDPGWQAYLERLAAAYHDAFERAPALPRGDEAPSATHVARVWTARAVREVLAEGMAALGVPPPARI